MKNKLVFVAGTLGLPRIIKRIRSFYDAGYDIIVYAFDRSTFQNINLLPPEIEVIRLGEMEDQHNYIKNFFRNQVELIKVFKKYRNEDVIYYAFSFVPASAVWLFSRKKYIYEISDLLYTNFSNCIIRDIITRVDKKIIRNALLTVFTSQGFIDYLFPRKSPPRVFLHPNKLNSYFKDLERNCNKIEGVSLHFAFVGYLRYPNTIFRFAKIIGEYFPQHQFLFYGDSTYRNMAIELSETYSNIQYYGKFKNPEELPQIYKNIDINVACYDTSTQNERIAEPNKLYESLFFSKPLVVSENTFLASRVKEFGCGYVINPFDNQSIIDFVKSLKVADLNEIIYKEYQLNTSSLLDNPLDLMNKINTLK